jgi:riboflavin transporter FmnP
MKTKSIALAIMFAAVAIALTAIKIPTFFYPGGFFRFSQIPIVIAFLRFEFRIGVSVGFVTLIGQIALSLQSKREWSGQSISHPHMGKTNAHKESKSFLLKTNGFF